MTRRLDIWKMRKLTAGCETHEFQRSHCQGHILSGESCAISWNLPSGTSPGALSARSPVSFYSTIDEALDNPLRFDRTQSVICGRDSLDWCGAVGYPDETLYLATARRTLRHYLVENTGTSRVPHPDTTLLSATLFLHPPGGRITSPWRARGRKQ